MKARLARLIAIGVLASLCGASGAFAAVTLAPQTFEGPQGPAGPDYASDVSRMREDLTSVVGMSGALQQRLARLDARLGAISRREPPTVEVRGVPIDVWASGVESSVAQLGSELSELDQQLRGIAGALDQLILAVNNQGAGTFPGYPGIESPVPPGIESPVPPGIESPVPPGIESPVD